MNSSFIIDDTSDQGGLPLPGHFPDGGAQPPHTPNNYSMSTKEIKQCVLFTTCLFLPLKLINQLVRCNQI